MHLELHSITQCSYKDFYTSWLDPDSSVTVLANGRNSLKKFFLQIK